MAGKLIHSGHSSQKSQVTQNLWAIPPALHQDILTSFLGGEKKLYNITKWTGKGVGKRGNTRRTGDLKSKEKFTYRMYIPAFEGKHKGSRLAVTLVHRITSGTVPLKIASERGGCRRPKTGGTTLAVCLCV